MTSQRDQKGEALRGNDRPPGTFPIRPSPFAELRTDLREGIETFKYSVTILNDGFINSKGISEVLTIQGW